MVDRKGWYYSREEVQILRTFAIWKKLSTTGLRAWRGGDAGSVAWWMILRPENSGRDKGRTIIFLRGEGWGGFGQFSKKNSTQQKLLEKKNRARGAMENKNRASAFYHLGPCCSGLKHNRSIDFSCMEMFFTCYVLWSLRLFKIKTEG